MPRLSARDIRRADEILAALDRSVGKGHAVAESAVPLLRELLETPTTVAYRFSSAQVGHPLDYVKFAGLGREDREARQILDGFFDGMSKRKGLWDAARPQAKQRNRVMVVPWARWGRAHGPDEFAARLRRDAERFGLPEHGIGGAAETMWELERGFRRMGLSADFHLRVLLCEGDSVLSLVGTLQEEPVTARQRLLLKRLVEPLRERLIVERRAGVGLGHAAMVAALEYVPAAAYVLDGKGHVAHANAVGRARLDREGEALRAGLSRAIAAKPGARGELAMTRLVGEGLPPLYLAIGGSHGDRVRYGIERARGLWGLTAREAEILAELAAGRTNRDIAERLAIAPRTVEVHLSSMLRKAHADSRSQLVIDLWELAEG